MAGVRGFADANLQINPDGLSVFQQLVPVHESGPHTLAVVLRLTTDAATKAHRQRGEWRRPPLALACNLPRRQMGQRLPVHVGRIERVARPTLLVQPGPG